MFYLAFNFSKLTDFEKGMIFIFLFVIFIFVIALISAALFEEEAKKKVEEEKRRQNLKEELEEEEEREYYESKGGLRSLILEKEQEIKYHEDLMDYLGKNSEAARLRKENIIAVLYKELEELYSKLRKLN